MSNPRVYIVVLQYNHSDQTIECLESLMGLNYPNYSIVVVDNGSESDHYNNLRLYTEQYRKNRRQRIALISNKSNAGYGGGNNQGISYALSCKADYVLLLNNDAKVPPDLIEKLLETAESDKNIGLVQPMIDEGNQIAYSGGPIAWFSPYGKHSTEAPASSIMPPKHYAIGAAVLVKKNVIDKTGMLDEKLFLYYEDADYSMRALQKGYKLATVTNTAIKHKVSSSASSLGSPLLLYYNYRNMLLFTKRYAPFYIRMALPFWIFFNILKQRAKLIFGIDVEESKFIIRALTDYKKSKFGPYDKNWN